MWARLVVFAGLAVSGGTLLFAPRIDNAKSENPNTLNSDQTQDQIAPMIANVLKDYQSDKIYRDWRKQYRNELFSGLEGLPPNQAVKLLSNRIDTLVVDLNAEIADMDAHLQSPPTEKNDNGFSLLIDAYAKKNKERIKKSLLDARQMIRDQPTTGSQSRELLVQLSGVLQ
jgi:hypothetical protein